MDDEMTPVVPTPMDDSPVTTPSFEPDVLSPDDPEAQAAPLAGALVAQVHQVMLKDIRSWGWWQLGFGVLNFVMSGLSGAGWGLLLIIVGAGSFVFKDAAMYVVYAVTLGWAGISNLIAGDASWSVFALFQFFMVYRVLQSYFRFRNNQTNYQQWMRASGASPQSIDLAARVFPWLGGGLGGFALTGVIATAVSLFAIIMTGMSGVPVWFDFLVQFVVSVGVLGLAVSLSAVLSRHRYKGIAIFGLCCSGLVLLIWLVVILVI